MDKNSLLNGVFWNYPVTPKYKKTQSFNGRINPFHSNTDSIQHDGFSNKSQKLFRRYFKENI